MEKKWQSDRQSTPLMGNLRNFNNGTEKEGQIERALSK